MSVSRVDPPNTVDPTIVQQINRFLAKAKEVVDKHYEENGFKFAQPYFEPDYGRKFCRIWKIDNSKSSYAFIALVNSQSKELGMVTAGEIFKPATWRGPAKHARGTIFQEDFNNCIGPYGISYLR